jgi:chromatin remodeling complex protein RSC6
MKKKTSQNKTKIIYENKDETQNNDFIISNEKVIDEIVPTINTNLSNEESNTEIFFNKLNNQFQDVISIMKTLQSNLKVLQKEVIKEKKELKKIENKYNKNNSKRKPHGFALPSLISDELADFLNVPKGSELARTEVTSKIISYVKEHNLQNPEKKK